MRREPVVIGPETTQVDDPTHAGRGGGGRKPLRREPVGPLEVDAALHRVDEPVGHLDTRAGAGQVSRVGSIALDDLCRGARSAGKPLGTPHQADDRVTAALQLVEQAAADVARGAGEEDPHAGILPATA